MPFVTGEAMGMYHTKLDMYGDTVSNPVFDALGQYVLAGIKDAPQDKLIFGMICGIEFAHAKTGQYAYLANFDLPEFKPGHYNSVLISRKGSDIQQASDIDLTRHVMAVNEPGSFSGSIAPAAHLLGRGDDAFPERVLTGGHLKSIEAVASGKADLAGIDRVSFNLGQHACPDSWQQVSVIDETPPRPGLPFICDGAIPSSIVALMQERLLHTAEQEFWPELRRLLGVSGISMIDESLFAAMRDV